MQISKAGVDLTKSFESCDLTPYKCPAGVWTDGWGNTHGVEPGRVITQEKADADLYANLQTASDAVNRFVKVPLAQWQFDALTSFVYNCGDNAFRESTLLRKLNGSDFDGAADELLRWNKSGRRVLNGLTRRRMSERCMFLNLDPYGP